MTPTEQDPPGPGRFRNRWLLRLALSLASSVIFAWLCGVAMRADASVSSPPGLLRGMLHGALMPIAWPTLLLGHDQEIYAARNVGRIYKLGYSLGVNVSGLFFFGWLFWTLAAFTKGRRAGKRGGS